MSQEEATVILPSENHPANTERATRQSVKLFYDFLLEKEIPEPEDASSLCEVLKTFYVQAKKTNGSLYSKNSFQSLRYGLCRHFKLTFGVDIINDASFKEANQYYYSVCTFLVKQGLDKTDQRPPISESDIRKLYQSGVFSLKYPRTLQNKVFFEILLFFCRRRKQNPRDLRSSDFEVRVDKNGRKYVCRSGQQVSEDSEETEEETEQNIMYERGGPFCPVKSLELYMKRLNPDNPTLFQKPKKDQFACTDIWYENVAYGDRALAEKMKKISSEAELSQQFSTHSTKNTSIMKWSKCLFGSCCSRVANKAGDFAKMSKLDVVESACEGSATKKRKVSQSVSESMDDGGEETKQESEVVGNSHQPTSAAANEKEEDTAEWMEYKCRSGQILHVKIAEKQADKTFHSVGVQTEDTSCINSCTSKYVSLPPHQNRTTPQATMTTPKSTYNVSITRGKEKRDVQHQQVETVFDDETEYDSDSDGETFISESDSHETRSYSSDLSAVLKVLDAEPDLNPKSIRPTASGEQGSFQRTAENHVPQTSSSSSACKNRGRHVEKDYETENTGSALLTASSERGSYQRTVKDHVPETRSHSPACRDKGRQIKPTCGNNVQDKLQCHGKNDQHQDHTSIYIGRDVCDDCNGCQDYSNTPSSKRRNIVCQQTEMDDGHQSRSNRRSTVESESAEELQCHGKNDKRQDNENSGSSQAKNASHKDNRKPLHARRRSFEYANEAYESLQFSRHCSKSDSESQNSLSNESKNNHECKPDNDEALHSCAKKDDQQGSTSTCSERGRNKRPSLPVTHDDCDNDMLYHPFICKQRCFMNKEQKDNLQEQGKEEHKDNKEKPGEYQGPTTNTNASKQCGSIKKRGTPHHQNSVAQNSEESQGCTTKVAIPSPKPITEEKEGKQRHHHQMDQHLYAEVQKTVES